jgi:murein hydrolase activator
MKGNIRNTSRFYVVVSCIAVLLFITAAATMFAQNDRNKLQSRKSKLEKEIIQMNRELEQTKKNKSANLNQLVLINNKISKREELIREIDDEVGSIESQVKSMSDTIYRINLNLKSLKDEYARIVYSTYRNRSAYNRLMFIFSARNFNQAYKRLKYLQQYTEYRKTQVNSITEAQRVLATKKLELEKRKSSKLTLKHLTGTGKEFTGQ